MLKKLRVRIQSTSPMLMHNGQLSDPSNPIAKEMRTITSKRNKTDDDYDRLSELEFTGGLYVDNNGKPCLPADVLESCLRAGGAVKRNGRKVLAGAFIEADTVPLEYEGPKTVEGLLADERFIHKASVRVTTNRVMRTRPRFDNWAAEFDITYIPDSINREEVVSALEDAGQLKGVGDYRPRFGRFEVVEVSEEVSEVADVV